MLTTWTGAIVTSVALLAACGGGNGSPKATVRPASTSTVPTTAAANQRASAADIAGVDQQLATAGKALDDSNSAVSGADVNTAKAQEGSAP